MVMQYTHTQIGISMKWNTIARFIPLMRYCLMCQPHSSVPSLPRHIVRTLLGPPTPSLPTNPGVQLPGGVSYLERSGECGGGDMLPTYSLSIPSTICSGRPVFTVISFHTMLALLLLQTCFILCFNTPATSVFSHTSHSWKEWLEEHY